MIVATASCPAYRFFSWSAVQVSWRINRDKLAKFESCANDSKLALFGAAIDGVLGIIDFLTISFTLMGESRAFFIHQSVILTQHACPSRQWWHSIGPMLVNVCWYGLSSAFRGHCDRQIPAFITRHFWCYFLFYTTFRQQNIKITWKISQDSSGW